MELELTSAQRDLFGGLVRSVRDGLAAAPRSRDALLNPRWDAVRAAGLAGLAALPNQGGRGAGGDMDLALAMQALGYAGTDAPTLLALSCHLSGGVLPLSRWGTPQQQTTWLPRLITGEWYAAHTLPDAVEAVPIEGGFRLTGAAEIASAGQRPDLALVFARAPGSETADQAFFVPLAEEAGSWERASGSVLISADRLRLDGVAVPRDRILGSGGGFSPLLELLPREQLALHATRLGLLQRLLETSLESGRRHARRLKLKGVPPHRYQMLGHRLADFQVRFDAAELLLRRAAWQLERRTAATEVALAGLAIENGLLPAAFEVVKLQHDYALDADHAWMDLLSSVVEYGRYLYNPAQMRNVVASALKQGIA